MRKIELSIKEWYLFKEIANFFYEVIISNKQIIVIADNALLENLGY